MIYLDTHVAAWLYAGRTDLLTKRAAARIEEGPLLVSPMVVLELQYLYEVDRVSVAAAEVMTSLGTDLGLRVCDLPFARS
jgi:PIN domain nuclease of toxin-antitoxin system